MFSALALLCLLAPSALEATFAPGFRMRYNESGLSPDYFISLPQSTKDAAASGWSQVSRPDGPKEYSSLVLWCPKDDHSVCVLYDDTEYVAGLQIGLDQESLHETVFDLPTIGFTKWATMVNGKPRNYWTLQQYYLSGAKLATNEAARLASRDPSKLIQDTDIYVSGLYGRMHKISTNPKDLDNSIFKKQNCINKMGTHYYYNMTSKFECADGNMYPWFPLVFKDQMVGLGLLTYGRRTLKEGQKDFLENHKVTTIEAVLREKVPCMSDLSKKKLMLVVHTYFVDKPYDIKC